MNLYVIVAALLIVIAPLVLVGCAVIAAKPKKPPDNQRQMDLARAQKNLYDSMRAERIHMLDSPRYKPAVFYLSPEKPEQAKPANVTKLRRKS